MGRVGFKGNNIRRKKQRKERENGLERKEMKDDGMGRREE